ncbi:hypothetical protein [Burkholderia territorii]|uniref:hypothetical protein n=1 Tax=Burkholderia territorii TaxID=1503055 RepID=UPI0012D97C40|nr:hypothetical protein [Burkholderia territorii]
MYEQLEAAAMADGVSRAAIRDELAHLRLTMSLGTFDLTLKRIRRERCSQGYAPRATQAQAPFVAVMPPAPPLSDSAAVSLDAERATPMTPALSRQLSPPQRQVPSAVEKGKYLLIPTKTFSVSL